MNSYEKEDRREYEQYRGPCLVAAREEGVSPAASGGDPDAERRRALLPAQWLTGQWWVAGYVLVSRADRPFTSRLGTEASDLLLYFAAVQATKEAGSVIRTGL